MSERTQFTLRIEGMTCDGCSRHVTEALKNVPGVVEAQVPGWRSGQATVVAETNVTDEALTDSVRDAGYRAIVRERRALEGERRAPKAEGADFDLMIIGGGSAAFAAAIKAAELGASAAIIEAGTIGGTCVNIGCVPSKTLIKAAEVCYKSAYPKFEGLTACPPPSDWQSVVQQKDELVAALREGKYLGVLDAYPTIKLIRGKARLTGGRDVVVNGDTYHPGKIIIATGSSPYPPPIAGLKQEVGNGKNASGRNPSPAAKSLITNQATSVTFNHGDPLMKTDSPTQLLKGVNSCP